MRETPRLLDDCFTPPTGSEWTPVATALAHLRGALRVVVGIETVGVAESGGRVLAADAIANRANPPYANAAVDGYGFCFASLAGNKHSLPLVQGRAAAGQPYSKPVPATHAIRILTGAKLPDGVDTIVMQEDVVIADNKVVFAAGLKAGANCRAEGEDIFQGDIAVAQRRQIKPPELALLAALDIKTVSVFKRLRVGILSSGDEICDITSSAGAHQIIDANRPMLLEMVQKWGFEAVDLGIVSDDPTAVVDTLNSAAKHCDAILTSGGASAGDEDHMSKALRNHGKLDIWKIAVKPGRPLALGVWNSVPVFGLPGNPVAAFVTTVIFARPALLKMQGGGWQQPMPVLIPAAFAKSKKAGRREYLRARINDHGQAERFNSEGSGRISGLSWADGLIELSDTTTEVKKGQLVRYFPFSGFGL